MAGKRAGSGPRQGSPETVWSRLGKDRAYKAVLSNRYLAEDLVRRFSPAGLAELLDFSTLREENPELIRGGLRARKADVLWSVLPRDGGPRVYFLFEAQSSVDPSMAVRMHDLSAGLAHKFLAGRRAALPSVVCWVVYSGEPAWTAKRSLRGLRPKLPRALDAWQSVARYFLLDLRRFRGPAREARDSVAAALVRLHQCRTLEESQREIEGLVQLTREAGQPVLGDGFADLWFNDLVPEEARSQCAELLNLMGAEPGAKLEGVSRMLKERKADWIRDWREEGRSLGKAEGRLEALRDVVIGQAQKVYGRAKARDIARLLDSERAAGNLDRIALWLVECGSADDLMARIRAI